MRHPFFVICLLSCREVGLFCLAISLAYFYPFRLATTILKFLRKILLSLIVLFVIAYFAGNYFLTKESKKYLVELRTKMEAKGLFFEDLSYKDITISSLRSVSINDVRVNFKLDKEIYGRKSFKSAFQAESVVLKLVSLNDLSFTFSISDFSILIEPSETSSKQTFGEFEEANFSTNIPIKLKSLEVSSKLILEQVQNLFDLNKAVGLDMKGLANITIDLEEVTLGVKTVAYGDSVRLQFNQKDIAKTAALFNIELTDQEAEVISNHPSMVPNMIRITREAKNKSVTYRKADRSFPEDAFRHVYWSYHLTRQLGPELAKQITDAHETAPGNTTKERSMDYHNNEVGRDLANTNLSENQIRTIVLKSERVVRQPTQAPD